MRRTGTTTGTSIGLGLGPLIATARGCALAVTGVVVMLLPAGALEAQEFTVANAVAPLPTSASPFVVGQSFTPVELGAAGSGTPSAGANGRATLVSVTFGFAAGETPPDQVFIYDHLPSSTDAQSGAESLGTGVHFFAGTYALDPGLELPLCQRFYVVLPEPFTVLMAADGYPGGNLVARDPATGETANTVFDTSFSARFLGGGVVGAASCSPAPVFLSGDPGRERGYEYVAQPGIDWETAEDAARDRSLPGCFASFLATIAGVEENDLLLSLLPPTATEAWLGARVSGDEVQWVTGQPVSYTNWAPGEPSGDGDFLAMWGSGNPFGLPGGTWNDEALRELVDGYLVEWRCNACRPNAETLCIDDSAGDGRFQITAEYASVLAGGLEGRARATALGELSIPKGGVLAFTDPANPEVLVKVLNGCGINDHYWVFVAATTTIGYELTVTDTHTNEVRVYRNPDLQPSVPVTDTSAFATCP